MIAVIIAGGEGTRLRPLTYNTPKPMVPVCGRPIIDYQIELCRLHGLTDIVVNLHYLAQELEAYLGDGSSRGMRIRYSHERDALGTAGAVKLAAPFFDDDSMIVFNGDILTDLDLTALLALHRQTRAAATITVTEVKDPTPFGLVLSADTRITQFLEKVPLDEARRHTERFWINAGTYVLDPAIFDVIPEGTAWSFERQVFPGLLAAGKPMAAFESEAYWLDCGSPVSYQKAHRDVLSGLLPRSKTWRPWPNAAAPLAWIDGEADLAADLIIDQGPVFIGNGAHIGTGVRLGPFAIVGAEAMIDDGVRIEAAIVGRGTFIGSRSEIKGGIIGAHSRIEADVRLNGSTLLADHSVIGRGTCLA